jgi:hypothetical protein
LLLYEFSAQPIIVPKFSISARKNTLQTFGSPN